MVKEATGDCAIKYGKSHITMLSDISLGSKAGLNCSRNERIVIRLESQSFDGFMTVSVCLASLAVCAAIFQSQLRKQLRGR